MELFNTAIDSPILITLVVIFAITSSITTFDKRLIQARRVGNVPSNEQMLPSWVALVYWVHYGIIGTMLILNWKFALGIIVIGFILEVLPVWEIIGNILMSPFKAKR